MNLQEQTRENVRDYYGKKLQGTKDLQTNACCPAEGAPLHHQKILEEIDEEILTKFYGCGSPVPEALEGATVLDLGCGTGRDVYLASRLAGEKGYVIGVDMTEEQLEVGRNHLQSQMLRFGYKKANVDFRQGYIENLEGAAIGDESIDVVISNCVINLSTDKRKVFSEIFRVLKPGGELYFSDVFSGRRIPEKLRSDSLLRGECLSGAVYIEDFRRLLRDLGCLDYRKISQRRITIDNPAIEGKVGMIDFHSITVRAFKLSSLEDICEDYGQVAIYLGTMPYYPHKFVLDDHHTLVCGKPMLVCGNTAAMLQETRLAKHFRIIGDKSVHYGPFPCGPALKENEEEVAGCC